MNKKYNYIIGDIHGCFDELLKLESKIKEDAEINKVKPFIISCGDLIDRGHHSREVLEHFFKGEKKKTHLAVIGNHEVMILQSFECFSKKPLPLPFPKEFDTYRDMYELNTGFLMNLSWDTFRTTLKGIWLGQGGNETLRSFGLDPDNFDEWKIDNKILEYLIKMPLYYEGENFIVTHGLANKNDFESIKKLSGKESLSEKEILDLKKTSNVLIWNRVMPLEKINNKIHISGHTPIKKVKRLKRANAIQIDTACVFGNKLTAYCPETDTLISIDSKTKYK